MVCSLQAEVCIRIVLSIHVGHAHMVKRDTWPLTAQIRRAANISIEKKHKARFLEIISAIIGDIFVGSCMFYFYFSQLHGATWLTTLRSLQVVVWFLVHCPHQISIFRFWRLLALHIMHIKVHWMTAETTFTCTRK